MALAQQRAARAATAKNAAVRPCIRLMMGPVRCPRNTLAAAPLSRRHLRVQAVAAVAENGTAVQAAEGQARPIFPFTAVIGQEEMKLALILNVIDPKIGGVMIMGDRGTGKTTTIRALADLLPQVPVVAKDPFNSGARCSGLQQMAETASAIACEAGDKLIQEVCASLSNCVGPVAAFYCPASPTTPYAAQLLSAEVQRQVELSSFNAVCAYAVITTCCNMLFIAVCADPFDAELMSEEVRQRLKSGEELPVGSMKIPMVDLPLGATEDRVCGTIDIEKALTEGVKAFEPGLLAKANRGILYVDEVNLLDDHLVDVLLDSAASGWNTVEREGISISHPARFILVGSGNPEEGELRPQLLDRFGMHAQIGTVRDPELRVQIVSERSTFDENPADFHKKCAEKQKALTQRIVDARTRLKTVAIAYDFRVKISAICSELNVDGIRGDIVTNRAAKALASFEGRDEVAVEDIYRVIPLCLRHRLRKDPMADIDNGDRVRQVFKQIFAME
eukprot:GHRQ01017544.1.p1 GENE.GHRQ01017544.1~~GHRQ01017544.1.p1  ORF type:complete len:505 (+),score=198.16 GHRQ01017544.1:146-1660(+)